MILLKPNLKKDNGKIIPLNYYLIPFPKLGFQLDAYLKLEYMNNA